VSEEEPEHLGDDKDDLTVGDIQEECLPHPPGHAAGAIRGLGRGTVPDS
jgi:hypothetical protein